MKRPQIISRIKEALLHTAPGAKTILYGSEARGDARPDSDIELETGIQINPIIESLREWGKRFTPFYDNITKEGILI